MEYFKLGGIGPESSRIAVGCMRIASLSEQALEELVESAISSGINFFDHADIYGRGACEEAFGALLKRKPSLRQKIVLQSKCGICKGSPGYYDASKKHIFESVDNSLRRLQTDHLDVLLLHRPDVLADPEELAEAFLQLKKDGKVLWFGLSNCDSRKIELFGHYFPEKLLVNQLQLSVASSSLIREGINTNIENDASLLRDNGLLDYCQLHKITVQAWSPLQYGFLEGSFLGSEKYPELNKALQEIGSEKGLSPAAVAIAWLLRHPAGIQPIMGTTNPAHLLDVCKASRDTLSRQEWYRLYLSAGNKLP